MKKLIALLLAAVMCLSFVACNSSMPSDSGTLPPNEDTVSPDSGTLPPNEDTVSPDSGTLPPNEDTMSPDSGTVLPNEDTISPDNDDSQHTPSEKDFRVDLDGYVANIGNATALGIAQKPNLGVTPVMAKGGIALRSFVKSSSNEDTENKNYIVMSTTEYDANTPEADKNGLTKVTFTKIVTENVTTETTGTKYITASEGQITILAVNGFTYTIYENETLLHESVQDNDATDTNDQEGVIVLTGLNDGTEYKVYYKGIGEEITITQDEINGEIDKLYSMYGYTFISFVPEGNVQRPIGDDITYDHTGIALYDKCDYTSNSERQSFVIDNTTGLVYALDGFSIDRIENGVIISSDKHFDMEAQENGELKFTQIVQNETIEVHSVYKDKYGTKYVHNDSLDGYDEANKTVYYKIVQYYLSDEGVVLYIDVDPNYHEVWFNPYDIAKEYRSIQKIGADFVKSEISNTETYHFVFMHGKIGEHEKVKFGYIKNGYMYAYITQQVFYASRTSLATLETECKFESNVLFDYDTALFLIDGTLYYGDLWGDKAYQVGSTENLTELAKNCEMIPGSESGGIKTVRYRYTTFTETIFYKIITDENGNPKAVSETYLAPDREVITLQPINK